MPAEAWLRRSRRKDVTSEIGVMRREIRTGLLDGIPLRGKGKMDV